MSLEELVNLGEKLGYEKEELREFVENERKERQKWEDREDRRRQTEREREDKIRQVEIEREDKARQAEIERDERAAARQEEKDKREHDERARQFEKEYQDREAERQAEREKREHEIKRDELRANSRGGNEEMGMDGGAERSNNNHAARAPKLPFFDEDKDDMDSYISRFERHAGLLEWRTNHYAAYLAAHLRGNSLRVYDRLPQEEAQDYDRLKEALLKHYSMNEEGFKRKFHTAKMEAGETAQQFMSKLGKYFDRWIEMSNIDKDYKELRDFMVIEKFLHLAPNELSTHIREFSIRKLEEVVKQADIFMEAHKYQYRKTNMRTETHNTTRKAEKEQPKPREPTKMNCFICGKLGHKAVNCRSKNNDGGKKFVHRVSTCLITDNTDSKAQQWLPISIESNACVLPKNTCLKQNLPIEKGTINGKVVQTLRDTGCTGAIVKKDLLTAKQLTGETGLYMTVDKTIRSAPIAEVYVDTPFYRGIVSALCLENPICELIIGNIEGASTNLDQKSNHGNNSKDIQTAAATTRSKTGMERKPNKPLVTPKVMIIDNPEKFREEQTNDNTLSKLREAEKTNKEKIHKSITAKIKKQNGLYYRHVYDRQTQAETKNQQLLVPESFRNTVIQKAHDSNGGERMRMAKTKATVLSRYFWPGIHDDIERYYNSHNKSKNEFRKNSRKY